MTSSNFSLLNSHFSTFSAGCYDESLQHGTTFRRPAHIFSDSCTFSSVSIHFCLIWRLEPKRFLSVPIGCIRVPSTTAATDLILRHFPLQVMFVPDAKYSCLSHFIPDFEPLTSIFLCLFLHGYRCFFSAPCLMLGDFCRLSSISPQEASSENALFEWEGSGFPPLSDPNQDRVRHPVRGCTHEHGWDG